MISKNLYILIIVRVLLLVVVSLLAGWTLFEKEWYFISFVLFVATGITTVNLVWFLNSVNRRLFWFFDAIRNDDSTLSFPEKTNDRTMMELNKSLNRVNRQIQQIKIDNLLQEQVFQALLEHVATGILTFDQNGFILHCNSAVRKLFSIRILNHLNQLQRIDHRLFQAVKTIRPAEQRLVTLDNERGNIQLLIKASSFKSKQKDLILLSVQDIKNELDDKELDSWLKLIRVLMHEIMNSVTPIASLSESLAGYFMNDGIVKSPAEIDEKVISTTIRGLDIIHEQGKGLIAFVNSYRQLTRLPEPQKKPFRAKGLIENILLLSGSFEYSGNVEISVQVTPEEMEILADEKMISQVLVNLLKNAFQAYAGNRDAKVQITANLDGNNRPRICVSDNGPGIPEEIIDKIFVPFFTTRENGTGIGLSLSRQIMRLHGGSLTVKSVPGKETTFSLEF
jgi:nitrogen fixation/metabolism regulation signal transduction histidine kinase